MAFATNIQSDVEVLTQGGSIATYATSAATTEIPFWQLVFGNARVFFIGSDDVPTEAKLEATRAINEAFQAGWQGLIVAAKFPLAEIAQAHESVDHPTRAGGTIVTIRFPFVLRGAIDDLDQHRDMPMYHPRCRATILSDLHFSERL